LPVFRVSCLTKVSAHSAPEVKSPASTGSAGAGNCWSIPEPHFSCQRSLAACSLCSQRARQRALARVRVPVHLRTCPARVHTAILALATPRAVMGMAAAAVAGMVRVRGLHRPPLRALRARRGQARAQRAMMTTWKWVTTPGKTVSDHAHSSICSSLRAVLQRVCLRRPA
jgi:hypothetical protein